MLALLFVFLLLRLRSIEQRAVRNPNKYLDPSGYLMQYLKEYCHEKTPRRQMSWRANIYFKKCRSHLIIEIIVVNYDLFRWDFILVPVVACSKLNITIQTTVCPPRVICTDCSLLACLFLHSSRHHRFC